MDAKRRTLLPARWVALLVVVIGLTATAGWAGSQAANQFLAKGLERYEFAEFQEAREALQKALKAGGMEPDRRAKALYYLGLIQLAQEDQEGAKAFFTRAKAAYPGFKPNPDNSPPLALELYARASGRSAPAQSGVGAKKPCKALKAKAKKTEPSPYGDQEAIERRRQARLDFVRGVDEFNAGNYQQAEFLFREFLEVFPGDIQGGKFLSMARRMQESFKSGALEVLSEPGGDVFINGVKKGRTPLRIDKLPAGSYLVEVRSGQQTQSRRVTIRGRAATSVVFDLKRYEIESGKDGQAGAKEFVHPRLGYAFLPPAGWSRQKGAEDLDLRTRAPGGKALLDFRSYKLAGLSPREWVAEFEKKLTGPGKAARLKLHGKWTAINGRQAYEALYHANQDGYLFSNIIVFMKGRVHLFSLVVAQGHLRSYFNALKEAANSLH